MGKGEIAHYEQFILFFTVFFIRLVLQRRKNQGLFGKGSKEREKNSVYQHFSPVLILFSKAFFVRKVKFHDCLKEGVNLRKPPKLVMLRLGVWILSRLIFFQRLLKVTATDTFLHRRWLWFQSFMPCIGRSGAYSFCPVCFHDCLFVWLSGCLLVCKKKKKILLLWH